MTAPTVCCDVTATLAHDVRGLRRQELPGPVRDHGLPTWHRFAAGQGLLFTGRCGRRDDGSRQGEARVRRLPRSDARGRHVLRWAAGPTRVAYEAGRSDLEPRPSIAACWGPPTAASVAPHSRARPLMTGNTMSVADEARQTDDGWPLKDQHDDDVNGRRGTCRHHGPDCGLHAHQRDDGEPCCRGSSGG